MLRFVYLLPLAATPVFAEPPKVVTDIPPVTSLAAQVMKGVGEPSQMIPAGASPHDHSLRPSEAKALDAANVVFWIGEELSPNLQKSIESLASDATVTALFDAEGTHLLATREEAVFDTDHGHDEHDEHDEHGHDEHDDHDKHEEDAHKDHDHDEHEHEHEEYGHDEHDEHKDHDHAEHDEHDEHAHDEEHAEHDDHDDHHGHNHGPVDPHVWLDPDNAKLWLGLMAETLAAQDAENAETYRANAAEGQAQIDQAVADARATLSGTQNQTYAVLHDAFQYFEDYFELSVLGAITDSDAADASPARLAQLRDAVADASVSCFITEPQANLGLVQAIDPDIATAEADQLGTDLTPGATLYPDLIRKLATDIAACGS